ncbi:MAG: hypothetical protein HY079_13285 [Elusimicrobia bacterium]|nr:hypothetical protein [Elusimicrobiota bacterium]
MKSTFLERNKKKSALAALLLFLRQRKAVVVLLLLVLIASTVFLSPSSWMTGLPGGTRLAASVAWVAGKMGVDVSQWGLAGDKHSFNDLMAAFASAKANSGKGPIGWGAFFGRPSNAGSGAGGAGSAQDSLGFVKGSKSDLESAGASAKGGGISGAFTPEDSKNDPDGNTVALDSKDVGGEREGWVKSAFAGGFMNGLLGGGGAGADGAGGGAGALSGGAYAGKGFFGGRGGAVSGGGDLVKKGLEGVDPVQVPKNKIAGANNGKATKMTWHRVESKAMASATGKKNDLSNFGKLAEGSLRARASSPYAQQSGDKYCAPPGCPGEFAVTNTGSIYDGSKVEDLTKGFVSAPPVDGMQSPAIPDTAMAQDYLGDAARMQDDAKKCQDLDKEYGPREQALLNHISSNDPADNSLMTQFNRAGCGSGGCSKSKANYCKGLGNQMRATCQQYQTVRCQHSQACPLTSHPGKSCPDANDLAECNQGDGVHSSPTPVHAPGGDTAVTVNSNGERSQGAMTTGAKNIIETDSMQIRASNDRHTADSCADQQNQRYDAKESQKVSILISVSQAYYDKACDKPTPPITLLTPPAERKKIQDKINFCKSQVGRYHAVCGQYNDLRCTHLNACESTRPETADSCRSDCADIQTADDLKKLQETLYGKP